MPKVPSMSESESTDLQVQPVDKSEMKDSTADSENESSPVDDVAMLVGVLILLGFLFGDSRRNRLV